MNKKRVKELKKFIEIKFPEMVGDKSFFRMVKKTFKASIMG